MTHRKVLGLLIATAVIISAANYMIPDRGPGTVIAKAFVFWLAICVVFLRRVSERPLGWSLILAYTVLGTLISSAVRQMFIWIF